MEDYIYNTINDLRTSGEPLKYYGIRSVNCYAPVISSNTITPVPFNGNQPGASSDINTGIQIENTWAATLNCNVIRKTGTSLVVSGANPMATITNNDFMKSYYGIYTKNSGYTGDLGNATHPADNQWVGINTTRQQVKATSIIPTEIIFCRNITSYIPYFDPNDAYHPSIVSQAPNVFFCPQQIVIDPIDKAQKTITQDVLQLSNESKTWVKKGMNKIVKNDLALYSDSVLSVFIDSIKNYPTGILDSVLVLREADLTEDANVLNSALIPETIMDELDKEVNQYFLKIDISGIASLSTLEVDRIREMASLCPFTEGEAVYRARILAASFDSVETEYINNCEVEIEERSMISQSENIQIDILVVPNPAMNEIAFSSDDSNEEGILHLYDLSGRCVWNGSIILNSSRINIADLSNGLYHYSLLIGNNVYNGHFTKMSD